MIRLFCLLSVALLSGCAAHHAMSAPDVMPQSEAKFSSDWHLQGRLLVNDGRDAWHARVDWVQRSDDFDMTLNGVLGRQLAKLYGNEARVSMQLPGEPESLEDDVDVLFERVLGVQVPVSGLRYWVQGRPSPTGLMSHVERDQQGRITRFMQAGWHVRFVGESGDKKPHKVFLSKPPHAVRLVIDSFSLL